MQKYFSLRILMVTLAIVVAQPVVAGRRKVKGVGGLNAHQRSGSDSKLLDSAAQNDDADVASEGDSPQDQDAVGLSDSGAEAIFGDKTEDNTQAEIASLQEQVQRLQQQLDIAQQNEKALDEQQRANAANAEEIAELHVQLATEQVQNEKALDKQQRANAAMTEEIAELQATLATSEHEKTEELEGLRAANKDLDQQFQEQRAKCGQFENEKRGIEKKLGNLKDLEAKVAAISPENPPADWQAVDAIQSLEDHIHDLLAERDEVSDDRNDAQSWRAWYKNRNVFLPAIAYTYFQYGSRGVCKLAKMVGEGNIQKGLLILGLDSESWKPVTESTKSVITGGWSMMQSFGKKAVTVVSCGRFASEK